MIKTMPESERPREKMLNRGSQSLSNTELLAIIMRTGSRQKSVIELANDVIGQCERDIGDLRHITIQELCAMQGIGPSKACQIMAAVELGTRIHAQKLAYGQRIASPNDVIGAFKSILSHEKVEKFVVAYLSTKNEIISTEVISIGSLNASIVHPREVYGKAVRLSAASIIAVHNHPSGDPTPSREDRNITQRLHEAGKLLGIALLDHIIIGGSRYYSFKENEPLE
ncbi:MAG: repair protein RadC [Clostridiales bacterium]|jgi:DNA repair protein RadC|nr:repair protein RadC [Clostridiales bacterium]MDN5298427.1 repair protein RadC [Clostridiales bacterium]